MFFIDESGSIPKFNDRRRKNRFFVVGFVHTNHPKKLERVFNKAILDLRKYYPEFFRGLKDTNEMKGSEAHPFMKLYILEQLLKKTDVTFAHMVVDNWAIKDEFKRMPSRTFNYLVQIIMKNFQLSAKDRQHLHLIIDNRNTAIPSLRSLEEYLYNEMVLGCGLTQDVSVDYVQSSENIGIQVADIFTNTVFQKFRYEGLSFPRFTDIRDGCQIYPETHDYLYRTLLKRIKTPFVYPPYSQSYSQVAAAKGR